MFSERDHYWMQQAILLAKKAEAHGEVPIGAVLTLNDELVGEGYNAPIEHHDASAHAEIMALRDAGKKIQNYRLVDTTLYVTLEPCVMCIGAIVHARVKRLVFGAYDLRAGAVASVFQIVEANKLNHRVECEGGLMQEECANILKTFFQARR